MPEPLRGQLSSVEVRSEALAGNMLEDAACRTVLVYTPPGAGPQTELPLVLMLAAFGSNHHGFVAQDPWKPNLLQRFERLLRDKKTAPARLVMPDVMTRFGGSQYVGSPVTGDYSRYLVREVIPAVEGDFRSAGGRAVAGRSSGGYGALRLVMDHPGVFDAAASHAGDGWFEVTLRSLLLKAAVVLHGEGGLLRWLERVERTGPGDQDYDPLFVLACAAAYAPNLEAPYPHADLPFEETTGEMRPEVWRRFLTHDVVHRLAGAKHLARELRLVFVDAGRFDEYGLQFTAARVAQELRAAGVNVIHETFEGGHRGTSHRYERSLPLLIRQLDR